MTITPTFSTRTFNSSDHDLIVEFYEPCLSWAQYYDRAVGFFTSGWLRANAQGISHFASNGGKARWITSPILQEGDIAALKKGLKEPSDIDLYFVTKQNIDELKMSLEKDVQNTLGWLVYDGILEFRFAIPQIDNEDGDFHDKFGIFSDGQGNSISFNGSINDSKKGFRNYESIKIFPSWQGMGDFVSEDQARFERLWNNHDSNVKVFPLITAVKEQLFTLRNDERPYRFPKSVEFSKKWRHQSEAIEKFLQIGNGVLEMATGTGKTRTAITILNRLYETGLILSAVITVSGNDLLEQWERELQDRTNLKVYRHFGKYKDMSKYLFNPSASILLISREFLLENMRYLEGKITDKELLICDEVHGLGSPSMVANLTGKLSRFKYRLGLSATPEREYDEIGNEFIESEIGAVIFRFKLEDAISRGILCEFDYYPLEYELTEEDRKKIRGYIASYHSKKKIGQNVKLDELYRDIARVKKVSKAKLPVFEIFIENHTEFLDRSIVFVETREFGEEVQKIIIKHEPRFHTYYAADAKEDLSRFSKGELSCLITSERISEGIDISTVKNIILFSADRAKLQTVQRIGRCLRLDPHDPEKKATVIDFIRTDEKSENDSEETKLSADEERKQWLRGLSNTKREE